MDNGQNMGANPGSRERSRQAVSALPGFDPGRTQVLSNELWGIHDALGFLENFEVREPDLHLTRVDCRAILREAARHLAAIATEAGTAATTKIDAVHEGAGPEDIAQREAPNG